MRLGNKIQFRAVVKSALIVTLFGLLLAVFSGTASAQDNVVIGRGFTGVVKSVSPANGLMAVASKGKLFQLTVTDATIIDSPPDMNVGLEGLPAELGFKIAGVVDAPITDESGFVFPEVRIASRITLVPEQTTRSHRRTIAADKEEGHLIVVDSDGGKTNLVGNGDDVQKGEEFIVLVQKPGRNATAEKVFGLIKAKTVSDRLELMAKAESDDLVKFSILADLRDKRETAQEARLNQTADDVEAGFSQFVLRKVETLQEDRVAREEIRINDGIIGTGVFECAVGILGRQVTSIGDLNADEKKKLTEACLQPPKPPEPIPDLAPVITITSPADGDFVSAKSVVTITATAQDDLGIESVTFNVGGTDLVPVTEAPYQVDVTIPAKIRSLEIKATAKDTGGNEVSRSITLKVTKSTALGVVITSPAANVTEISSETRASRPSTVSGASCAIAEGDTIGIRAEVTGLGVITVIFRVNGVEQNPISAPPYAMKYFVPYTSVETAPSLKISATATNTFGGSESEIDLLSADIVRNVTTVNIKIVTPTVNTKVTAGDTIVIRAKTDNDSDMAFATFSVDGKETVTTTHPFTHTYVLPRKASTVAAVSNVFVGEARLDGILAPDGTKVVAWMAGSDASKLVIKVTDTANSGESDTASLTLLVSGSINVGETTVVNGNYVLNASQPTGQSFLGEPITFGIGAKGAEQTGFWEQGAATILNLTAD